MKRKIIRRLKSLPIGCYVTARDFPQHDFDAVDKILREFVMSGFMQISGYTSAGVAKYTLVSRIVETPVAAPVRAVNPAMGTWGGLVR